MTGVLVAGLFVIGRGSGRGELLEGKRADAHAGIECDGHDAEVREFESGLAAPAGVEEAGGAVDDDSDSAKRRPAFEAAEDIVVEFEGFEGDGEGELAGLQDEGFAVGNDDGAHQGLDAGLITEIDTGVARVFEDTELVAEAEVDGATALLLWGERRVDFDFAGVDVALDVDVGKDHGIMISRRDARGARLYG